MSDEDLYDNSGSEIDTNSDCSNHKFIKLDVPDFDTTSGTSDSQSTYLRLGATEVADPIASTSATDGSGEDLAEKVTGFNDDAQTDRDGGQTLSISRTKADESAILHTKGGWRDHTDGNRISTTRGDKVEVIGGNYKLVVLGRNTLGGHDYDSSGGIEQSVDQTPYAIEEVKWVEACADPDGKNVSATWMVKTSGSKGDYYSVTEGYHSDTHTGDTFSKQTGYAEGAHYGDAKSFHVGDTDDGTAGVTFRDMSSHVNHHELTAWVDHQDLTAGVSSVSLSAIAQSFELAIGLVRTGIEICVQKSDVLIAVDKQDIYLGIQKVEIDTSTQLYLDAAGDTKLSPSHKILAGFLAFI